MPGKPVSVKDAFGPKRQPVKPPTARPKAKTHPTTQTTPQSESSSSLPIGRDAHVAPAILLPRPPSLCNPAVRKLEDEEKAEKIAK